MIRLPPTSTHRYTLFPYTPLFRSPAFNKAAFASPGNFALGDAPRRIGGRSEEHTSELQSHSGISYAVFCLKTKDRKSTRLNSSHIAVYRMPSSARKKKECVEDGVRTAMPRQEVGRGHDGRRQEHAQRVVFF